MNYSNYAIRLTVAGVLLILAGCFAILAFLIFLDVGLPASPRPGYMQLTSMTISGITLAGWEMYLFYIVPGILAVLCVWKAVRLICSRSN